MSKSNFTQYMMFLKGLKVAALREEAYKLAGWLKSARMENAKLKAEVERLKAELETKKDEPFSFEPDYDAIFAPEQEVKEVPVTAKAWMKANGLKDMICVEVLTQIKCSLEIRKLAKTRFGYEVCMYNPSDLAQFFSKRLK